MIRNRGLNPLSFTVGEKGRWRGTLSTALEIQYRNMLGLLGNMGGICTKAIHDGCCVKEENQ